MWFLAVRPAAEAGPTAQVLYKGPFAEAEDEEGTVYPRGVRVGVTTRTRLLLQQGEGVGQFLFFTTTADVLKKFEGA